MQPRPWNILGRDPAGEGQVAREQPENGMCDLEPARCVAIAESKDDPTAAQPEAGNERWLTQIIGGDRQDGTIRTVEAETMPPAWREDAKIS